MSMLLKGEHENKNFDKAPFWAQLGQDWTKIAQQDHGANNIISTALSYTGDGETRY